MALTDSALDTAMPKPRPYKMGDSGGLYLEVHPTGAKYWRLKYRYAGKEKRLSLGVYPETSLRRARIGRDEARRLLAQGVDPSANRKAIRAARVLWGGKADVAGLKRQAEGYSIVVQRKRQGEGWAFEGWVLEFPGETSVWAYAWPEAYAAAVAQVMDLISRNRALSRPLEMPDPL